MAKAKVAVLKCKPETILQDIERLLRARRDEAGARPGQDDHPEGQHLLALPVPRREHDAVADGGHHPGPQARAARRTSRACRTRRS